MSDDETEVPPPPPSHPHPDTITQQQQTTQTQLLPVSSPLAADAEQARGRRSRRESRADEHAHAMALAAAAHAAEEDSASTAGRGSMTLPPPHPPAAGAATAAVSPAVPSRRSRSGSLSASRSQSRRGSLLPPLLVPSDHAAPIVVAAIPSAAPEAAAESNGAIAAAASSASIIAASPITSPASRRSSALGQEQHLSAYDSSLHSPSPSPSLSPSPETEASSPPFAHHHHHPHLIGGHSFSSAGGAGATRKIPLDVLSPISSNSSSTGSGHLRSPSMSRSSHSQSRSQTRLTRGMSEWISAHSPFSPVSSRRGEHMGFGAGASSAALTSGAPFRPLPAPSMSAAAASAKEHASAGSSSSALVAPAPSKPVSTSSLLPPAPAAAPAGSGESSSLVEKLLSPLAEFFHRVTTPRVPTPQPPPATAAATEARVSPSPSPRAHARKRSSWGAPTTITTSAAAIQETGQRKRSDTQSDASPDSADQRRINLATRTRSPTAAPLGTSAAAASASSSDLPTVVETRDSAASLSNAHFTFSPPSVPRKISAISAHGVPAATETELFHVSFQTKSRARLAAAAAAAQADGSANSSAEHTIDPRASVSAYSLISPSKILSEEEEDEAAAAASIAEPIAEEDEDDEEEEGFGTAQPDFSGISSEQAAVATAAETLSSSKSSVLVASASSAAASSGASAAATVPFDIDTLLSDDEFSFFDSLAGYGFPDDSPLRFAWLASYSSVIQSQELAWESAMHTDDRVKALTEKQYKALTRQGIPAHFRAKIWWSWMAPETLLGTTPPGSVPLSTATAAAASASPSSPQPTLLTAYQSYLHAPCDEEVLRSIEKDVDRTFTTHPLFRDPLGAGCRALRNVLVAFANRNNGIGYTQSQNYLAAWFLIFFGGGSATAMGAAAAGGGGASAAATTTAAASTSETTGSNGSSSSSSAASSTGSSTLSPDPAHTACSRAEPLAFWMLCALVEKFLPARYFDSTMLGVAGDVAILLELVRLRLPKLWLHLGRLDCQALEGILTSWFLCGFIKTVPVETALRIWDSMLVEGSKVLFRVGLALIAEHEREILAMDDFGSAFNAFNQLGARQYDCDRLLKRAFELKSIKRGWIEAQRKKQQILLTKRFEEMEARRHSIEAAHADRTPQGGD